MTQEEKQLLLIDLCARLPYGVKVQAVSVYGYTVQVPIDGYCSSDNRFDIDLKWRMVDEFKPYLRPMSSMTEEEKKIFSTFGFEVIDHTNANRDKCLTYQVIEISNFSGITEVTDWLNAHHFDYRTIYDEDKKKYMSMIEKGLAIEAPEGMYVEQLKVK